MISSLLLLFLKSCFLGFLFSIPVGPVSVLCIRRTLGGCSGASLALGVGAAAADTMYAAIAGFSLAGISAFIQHYHFYLHLFGGLFVGWLGFRMLRSPLSRKMPQSLQQGSLFSELSSSFFLTLSNPVLLLVFAAAFAALNISLAEHSFPQGAALIGGVFLGAMGWWIVLTTGVHVLRHHLSENHLFWINRMSSLLLLGFSAYILLRLYAI